MTRQEQYCKDFYRRKTCRRENGSYEIGLAMKPPRVARLGVIGQQRHRSESYALFIARDTLITHLIGDRTPQCIAHPGLYIAVHNLYIPQV